MFIVSFKNSLKQPNQSACWKTTNEHGMLTTPEAPIGNQLSTTSPSTQGTQPIRGLPLVPSASQFLVQRIELEKQRRHGLIQLANTPGSTPSLPIQRQPDGLCDLSSTDGPWRVCRWLATIKCNATVCPKPACVAGIWRSNWLESSSHQPLTTRCAATAKGSTPSL